jgi:hypothetical protein
VRVTPEKQTLILAGEDVPRRDHVNSAHSRPLTIVATPADETMLLMQDGDRSSRASPLPMSPASAYLLTQALARSPRPAHLVDTYA